VSEAGAAPDEIASVVAASADVREDRRRIHRRAELGWCEFATTSDVLQHLAALRPRRLLWGEALFPDVKRLGVPRPSVMAAARERALDWGVSAGDVEAMTRWGTGVLAEFGGSDGPVVGIRVDMDALPIVESAAPEHFPIANGFASEVPGVMHACGHDGHVAIGLGVARVVAALGDRVTRPVRLMFQPAEEGTRGGVAFVDAGWLDDVETFFSFHLSGLSGLTTGAYSPGVDELLSTVKFDIELQGTAAHYSSAPQKGRSALIAGSAIALLSQSLPRMPGTRSLINVGRLDAGVARNVVPEHGHLEMEVRGETDELATDLFERVDRLAKGIASGMEVGATTTVVGRTPAADSSPSLVRLVSRVGGAMGLRQLDGLTMEASDDASAMMRRVQDRGGVATYAKVGTTLADGNHTPAFDFDEEALPIGVELLVRSLVANLSSS
jgi:aminobenzoyl-glutamate utilization protein A